MSKQTQAPERVIETSPVRLSAEETRLMMKAAIAGEPISTWQNVSGLADLGLMTKVKMPPKKGLDTVETLWVKAEKAVKLRRRDEAAGALSRIQTLSTARQQDGYILTPLGKEVARGLTVRLNAQYAKGAR